MANIVIRSNDFEDSITLTSEDGNVLEIAVTHLLTSEPTFTIGTYDSTVGADETYQTLYSCPVDAA